MQTALFQLAEDFLTAIVFVVVYLFTNSLIAKLHIAPRAEIRLYVNLFAGSTRRLSAKRSVACG